MFKGTTIIAVRKGDKVSVAGDGQITFGENTILKHGAKKIRRLYNGEVIVGFAGSVADALTLSQKFEEKLEQYGGNLKRAAVELAQEWRKDKILRKLEALLIAVDKKDTLLISGTGEVIEPDEDVIGIGSGGNYAMAAALALRYNTDLDTEDIAKKALEIASKICVYTNNNITVETL
ncbi:ATP dependent peptidase CodWX, CodW component. Threonine peptidase. MEROPS family T01B [Thermoanaerobacter thermohydrosulfuricus]|jgi:ATP-dependent HslUV protease subunit HslV|uniref:ATP-dependent protease subunit HslV n=6 Tax=Thermoanaerobacter TaxID=1754 RepID=HSLV_THEP3|nr:MULTISPECIES: ATP-dependent protease subunit HslV [Thermoanaerobacter]B0K9V4.1 RecName: Full=ATP-dependent protease subunit HslV [Thermoanaerobacter pseudethanolicus ATCC 33223]EGD52919.1 20S proteasome, A and B subunits [Thermoanaerobacter ethanolicus JW 200]ABY94917.1 ATP-dependent protease HslVU (ClpYQ) peptidase subunit-like protein [Thermoanaerobacter pseudethanolicus ATCC 33223]ADV79866.1 20S proteasome A and B subunits [Thermoanaerobacter brockii subsp. finnii Ako-1]AEM78825.1 ATP-de